MATTTQYNPNDDLNAVLLQHGLSKTVYALVTPEIEMTKHKLFGNFNSSFRDQYMDQFREAWTCKQDALHENFLTKWHEWSSPVLDLDRNIFPHAYPCNGASEAIRQIIFDYAARARVEGFAPRLGVFQGEYEGYRAMAEAAGIAVDTYFREDWEELSWRLPETDLFMVSQPSAIDGNIWPHLNTFTARVDGPPRIVVDLTYVGATFLPTSKFNMNANSIKDVVFSLSKPFGAYYDRIGGVFCREENLALFGNKWFKNLTSIALGSALLDYYSVDYMWEEYRQAQHDVLVNVAKDIKLPFHTSDVFLLASYTAKWPVDTDLERYLLGDLERYLLRGQHVRVCLTPGLAKYIAG